MNGPLRFGVGSLAGSAGAVLRQTDGSAILEFAIVLPLLVVFIAGIYDFGGAFNQKQRVERPRRKARSWLEHQPTSDLLPVATSVSNPDSLVPVVYAVFNSL